MPTCSKMTRFGHNEHWDYYVGRTVFSEFLRFVFPAAKIHPNSDPSQTCVDENYINFVFG